MQGDGLVLLLSTKKHIRFELPTNLSIYIYETFPTTKYLLLYSSYMEDLH